MATNSVYCGPGLAAQAIPLDGRGGAGAEAVDVNWRKIAGLRLSLTYAKGPVDVDAAIVHPADLAARVIRSSMQTISSAMKHVRG